MKREWALGLAGVVVLGAGLGCGKKEEAASPPPAVAPTLQAVDRAVQGSVIEVTWTGPAGPGDYITAVPAAEEDGKYGQYTSVSAGSPLRLTLPMSTGQHELRYMTGQGNRVLARRVVMVEAATAEVAGPAEAVAGALIEVRWQGPANAGDYITLVAEGTPDGKYGNYVQVGQARTVNLLVPMETGAMELRYMTGQEARVLARAPIRVVAAVVTLEASAQAEAGKPVEIVWTGPNHEGDYITIVPKTLEDGKYLHYAPTKKGSPVVVHAPHQTGPAEIRYMSGQGAKVLARREILVR